MEIALIVLALTNIGTLACLGFYIYLESKEKQKTINALIAKSNQDYLNNEMADKVDKIQSTEPIPPDMDEISQLDDEIFDEHIVKVDDQGQLN